MSPTVLHGVNVTVKFHTGECEMSLTKLSHVKFRATKLSHVTVKCVTGVCQCQ